MKNFILTLSVLAALSGAALASQRDSNIPDYQGAGNATVQTSDVRALAVAPSGKLSNFETLNQQSEKRIHDDH